MKITTAMLISALAFGSTATAIFAQNAGTQVVKVAPGQTVTINAVMKPVEKDDTQQFHVNRSAALHTGLQSTVSGHQLQAMPLDGRNPLDSITGGSR